MEHALPHAIYEECLLRFESCQEYDSHTTFCLSGVDVMPEFTAFCLILTVPSNLKTTVSNKVNISVPEIGHLSTTVTFNNPLNYFKSQLLIRGTVASRCIVGVCDCYL